MEPLPIIRLEVENMKHAILHHFTTHQAQVSDAVKREIEKTIKGYDYEGAVLKAVQEVLDSEIKRYFQYGKGKEIIKTALQGSLDTIFQAKPNGKGQYY